MEFEDGFSRNDETTELQEDYGLPDDLIQELDQALAEELTPLENDDHQIVAESGTVFPEEVLAVDPGLQEMQRTFLDIARHHLSPLCRYMKAISLGENSRELLEISELVVTPMVPRVESVGLDKHADELSFFRSLLLLALGERDQTGTRTMREVVVEGFLQLKDCFGLEFRGYRTAVRNLVDFYHSLTSSADISESDIRKFFAIGVPSLTWVRRTPINEMVSLSGISHEAMLEIRKMARKHRMPRKAKAQISLPMDGRAPVPKREQNDDLQTGVEETVDPIRDDYRIVAEA